MKVDVDVFKKLVKENIFICVIGFKLGWFEDLIYVKVVEEKISLKLMN